MEREASRSLWSSRLSYLNRKKYLYLMLIPVLAWYLIFCYVPMYGITMAFQDFAFNKGFFSSPFIGLENFKTLVNDFTFRNAFKNTIVINLIRIAIGFPIPILLALLLNEVRHMFFKRVIQTVTYMPHFISWVVMAGIFNSLFALNNGSINVLLTKLGFDQINFFMENSYFRTLLISSDIWKELGWNTIIYLAAIAGINPTLYEAAIMDGASRWQRIKSITIPSISNTIAILLILAVGNIMQVGFDQTFNLYNAAVYESSDIIDTYVVRSLQNPVNLGLPSAAGLIKSTINLAMLLMANFLSKKMGQEGIY